PLAAADVAAETLRMPPVRARRPAPPVAEVAQVDRPGGLLEHERARHELLAVGVGIVLGGRRALGPGDVPRRLHEPAELGDRHGVAVDRERLDQDFAYRPLLGIEAIGAHPERAAGQLGHVLHTLRAYSRMSISSASRSRSRYGSPLTSIPRRRSVPPLKRCGGSPGKSLVSGSPSWRPTYTPE